MNNKNQTNDRRKTERRDNSRNRRFWRAMSVERRHSSDYREPFSEQNTGTVAQSAVKSPDKSDSHTGRASNESAAIELTHDINALSDEELNSRRKILQSMLKVSEARHESVYKRRLPVLAPGQQVLVVRGEWQGKLGTILDADYIRGRVLLATDDEPQPAWLKFSRISAAPSAE
jgi:hypothetical protein